MEERAKNVVQLGFPLLTGSLGILTDARGLASYSRQAADSPDGHPPFGAHRAVRRDHRIRTMLPPATSLVASPSVDRPTVTARRRVPALSRVWFPAVALILGIYIGLPWFAPVFMRLGWTTPARAIYTLYSTQCHQMAQRSFFLFGPRVMYSPAELEQRAGVPNDVESLRAFIGSPDLGWKVAWSDRMVSLYTSIFVFGLLARLLRRRLAPLPIWALVLLAIPMALDGGTHLLSDLAGLGQGFRDQNVWLAALTGNALPASFYVGDALGSFNSWMRLLTGSLFGLGIVWTAFPHLERALAPAEP